mgnify:CR=1 FL=1
MQFANADTQIQDADLWLRKNGTDLANSNSQFSIPNSHGGTDGHLIAALNLFVDLAANDYVELVRQKIQVLSDLTGCLKAMKDTLERIERK